MMKSRCQESSKSRLRCLSIVAIGAACLPALAARLHVDSAATGTGDGATWVNAFSSLQAALDQNPQPGDEIWVAVGTGPYKPSVESCVLCTTTNPKHRTFKIPDRVKVYGGFLGTQFPDFPTAQETVLSQRDPERNLTILSGDLLGNDVPNSSTNRSDNVYHVVTADQVSSATLLSGFVIEGGNAFGARADCDNIGGGVFLWAQLPGALSAPFITRCTFRNNRAEFGGGAGVYWGDNSLSIAAARFVNCEFIDNVVVRGNTPLPTRGGGARVWNAACRFVNCVFAGNVADGNGFDHALGAGLSVVYEIDVFESGLVNETNVINCTFSANEVKTVKDLLSPGAGISAHSIAPPAVRVFNSILWGNIPDQVAPNAASLQVVIQNSDLDPNWPGTGNINLDPEFCNTSARDFRLQLSSPALDAGNNDLVPADITDIDEDGDPNEQLPWDRIKQERFGPFVNSTVDMGAFENPHDPTCQFDWDMSGAIDLPDLGMMLSFFGTAECFGLGCEFDFTCDRSVDLADLALFLASFGQSCPLPGTGGPGVLTPSVAGFNTNGFTGSGFAGETDQFVFDGLIDINDPDDDWTTSGAFIVAANNAAFRLAPDPNGFPRPASANDPDKYVTFFNVPRNVNANIRFTDPLGPDGAIAGACQAGTSYEFTTTQINACWYDVDANSKDGTKAVFRLVIDVSGVTGADTSSGFGSVYFSTSGPADPADIKVADLTFDAAHKHGGGTPVTLSGMFFVKKTP